MTPAHPERHQPAEVPGPGPPTRHPTREWVGHDGGVACVLPSLARPTPGALIVTRNWGAWEESLAHPDGRATGGEPCVVCGKPVPPEAHWKQRDRHVCSVRCNTNLKRRFNRKLALGAVELPPERLPNVARADEPLVFRTLDSEPFPYEHAGWSPRVGDIVDRHGSLTGYQGVWDEDGNRLSDRVVCVHWPTGSASMIGVNEHGNQANSVLWGVKLPGSAEWVQWSQASSFTVDGITWHWYNEIIRSIDADGEPYTWWAHVCGLFVPATLWSPEYRERSERLQRISSSESRHRRRERIDSTSSDRIDPLEVFASNGWVCALCKDAIDPELRHPHPQSASLDHIVPLAALGRHARDNVQAAHLLCNIRKGARILEEPSS